jgi:hypothetical protein
VPASFEVVSKPRLVCGKLSPMGKFNGTAGMEFVQTMNKHRTKRRVSQKIENLEKNLN